MSEGKQRPIRIVGYGTKPADQFQANPSNWRTHPEKQRSAVKRSLDELGWVDVVIENVTTGNLIDGHERVWQALQTGEELPYIQVELTPDEERLALTMIDWTASLAIASEDVLAELLSSIEMDGVDDLLKEVADDFKLPFGEESEEAASPYTWRIEAPVYEPSERCPDVSELYDDTETRKLVAEIEAADWLSPEEREFLLAAAQRHTVLRFDKIADFYAHAEERTQRLMENSALVIIDFQRAIELGYVRLTERIAEMVADEYGE